MSSVTTLPFFRLILIYISGLLLASYYLANRVITLMLLVGLIIVYLAVYIRSGTTTSAWLNLIGLLVVFFIGYSNLLLSIAKKTSLPKWIEDNQHLEGYSVCIEKVYHPLSCKALMTHIRNQTGWHNNHTYIQLYFSKQSSYKPQKGDRLLIAGTPVRRVSSDRVQQANHLISLPCIHRHFLKQVDQDFSVVNDQLFCRSGKWAASIRKWCSQTFQKQLKEQQSIALVSTLLWGDKEGLSLDLQKAYADTGTIHVLAISGLHVGMFYVLIHTVCRFIFSSISRFILPELSTCLWLWLYAWLCHFGPPILRATIMLTMARLGFLIGRGSNSYNGLLTSAFTLLLWNPCLLFNCGFQLSYLATLGILYLQPYIYRFIPLQNYWLQKIWTATTLSIAAQLGTFPLILYCFKQFPLYFIVANWLVVPAIFLILTLSLGLLVVSHLPIVNKLLGCTLEKLIFATNEWVCCVAKWPMSRLSLCLVNGHTVALLYIVLLLVCLFFQYKNLVYPIIITLCTAFYTVDQIQRIITEQKQCQMICYNNQSLSFTLKDGIETLSSDASPCTTSLLHHYAGGTIATWYKKIILTMHTIPVDWYAWRGTKLPIDYLLIEERLLDDLAILFKVLDIKTLVIYTTQVHALVYYPAIQKLGIEIIWLKPDEQKSLTWPKS